MDAKKPWQSKTLWVNLILTLAAFIPQVKALVQGNPDIAGAIVTGINIVLRFITKGSIQITDDAPTATIPPSDPPKAS